MQFARKLPGFLLLDVSLLQNESLLSSRAQEASRFNLFRHEVGDVEALGKGECQKLDDTIPELILSAREN